MSDTDNVDNKTVQTTGVEKVTTSTSGKEKLSDYFTNTYLNNSEFITKIEKSVTDEPVIKEIKEMLSVLKELSPNKDAVTTDTKSSNSNNSYNFDWNAIYDLSSRIIEEYSQQIDSVFKELEIVNKRLGYWQEAGFSFDAHMGLKIMNNHEEWTENKRKYLEYRQRQFDSTVKEIADSVGRLEKN